jgi:hypothetical protein
VFFPDFSWLEPHLLLHPVRKQRIITLFLPPPQPRRFGCRSLLLAVRLASPDIIFFSLLPRVPGRGALGTIPSLTLGWNLPLVL